MKDPGEILSEWIAWQLDEAREPLVIDIQQLFDEALR